MATQAISPASLQRIKALTSQWESNRGRRATPDVIRALMEAELEQSNSANQQAVVNEQNAARMAEDRRQFDETQKQNDRANTVRGAVDVVTAGATGYQAYTAGAAAKAAAAKTAAAAAATNTAATTGATTGTAVTGDVVAGTGAGVVTDVGSGGVMAADTMGGSGAGVVGTETAGASGAATGTSAGSGAAGGTSAIGAAAPYAIVAAIIADAKFANDNTPGQYNNLQDRFKLVKTGIADYGGMTQGQAAYMQKHGVRSPAEILGISDTFDSATNKVIGSGAVPDFVSDVMSSLGF